MSTRISDILKNEINTDAADLYGIFDKKTNKPEEALYILDDGRILSDGNDSGNDQPHLGHEKILRLEKLRRYMRAHHINQNDAIETFCEITGARRIFGDDEDIYCHVEKPFERAQTEALFNFAKEHGLNVNLLVPSKDIKNISIPADQLTLPYLRDSIKGIISTLSSQKQDKPKT